MNQEFSKKKQKKKHHQEKKKKNNQKPTPHNIPQTSQAWWTAVHFRNFAFCYLSTIY